MDLAKTNHPKFAWQGIRVSELKKLLEKGTRSGIDPLTKEERPDIPSAFEDEDVIVSFNGELRIYRPKDDTFVFVDYIKTENPPRKTIKQEDAFMHTNTRAFYDGVPAPFRRIKETVLKTNPKRKPKLV